MASFTKGFLSGSTNGKGVLVAATASTGTTIHQCANQTTYFEEIWLWAHNVHTANVVLTIEWGETTSTKKIVVTIPYNQGRLLVIDGLLLNNNLLVTAFAGTTNVITLNGFVNLITN